MGWERTLVEPGGKPLDHGRRYGYGERASLAEPGL